MLRTLDEADAAAELARRDDVVVIDVRTPAEQAEGYLAGAELMDVQADDFRDRVAELERNRTYFLYCRSGTRSGHAVRLMAGMGFSDVANIGGYPKLVDAGAPPAESGEAVEFLRDRLRSEGRSEEEIQRVITDLRA